MADIHIVMVALLALSSLTFITNIVQVLTESRRLKAEGKTPLTARNTIVVSVVFILEQLSIVAFGLLTGVTDITVSFWTIYLVFAVGYLFKNAVAYLTAWALWSFFVRKDRKQMEKELQQDKEEALL